MKSKSPPTPVARDLVVLVADKDIEYSLKGLLTRTDSLQIQTEISYDIFKHPHKDSGCLNGSQDVLSPLAAQYRFALVVFDREGSGCDTGRDSAELHVESQLSKYGWQDRCSAIAIEPEIESWVWIDSPHVPGNLNWKGSYAELKALLCQDGFWHVEEAKPHRPKEAVDRTLRLGKKPHSSAIFEALAKSVSIRRCQDLAFQKLQGVLQKWFPRQSS